jgi:betaine-aldehyde dehydrogenase
MDQVTNPRPDLYIGGEWRQGRGAEIESHFPADGSLNAIVSGASIEDVDFAIERAQEAVSDKAWRRLLPHERATYLYRIADGIAQHADRISQVQTRDTGKTLTETRALALSAAGTFRYMAATLETMEDALTPSRGNYLPCLSMSLSASPPESRHGIRRLLRMLKKLRRRLLQAMPYCSNRRHGVPWFVSSLPR